MRRVLDREQTADCGEPVWTLHWECPCCGVGCECPEEWQGDVRVGGLCEDCET